MSQSRRRKTKRHLRPWVKIAVPSVIVLAIFCAFLFRPKTKPSVTLEAGASFPTATEFLKKEYKKYDFITDVKSIDTSKIGNYTIDMKVGWFKYKSTLKIRDTIAPTAKAVDMRLKNGTEADPNMFVTDIKDVTAVTVTFKKAPKMKKNGEQEVELVLTDEGNNKTSLVAKLEVADDVEAPTITGVKDINIKVGETISYKSNVSVTDDQDEAPLLEIDSSNVNPTEPGSYKVIYKATDQAGNVNEVACTVTVEEVSDQELYVEEKIPEILDKLITDDMDDMQKLYEIWYFVHHNITYIGTSDKSNIYVGAYDALMTYQGDCYNYYALGKLLIEAAGFETIDMQRVDGHHFWSLVKIDSGWYHWDACVHNETYAKFKTFMMTDAEAEAYGKWVGREDYYLFDPTNIPPTPTESLGFNSFKLPTLE